jgi:hypothetical protein
MPSLPVLSEKPKNRPPLTVPVSSATRLALLLSLMLCGGLAGCGPAPDNAANLGPGASMDGPSMSKHSTPPHNEAFTTMANPLPLASVTRTGSASRAVAVQGVNSSSPASVLPSELGHPVDGLVVPEWMVQKLNSPNVRVRLRALETWAQSAPPGAVDPLILAFEDQDERVRARAQQLIEQDWTRKAGGEQ